MHQHVAHPPTNEHSQGLMDNLSDALLNAFTRVRKPDERFLAMRENVDKFEEGLVLGERLFGRIRSRTSGKSYLFPFNIAVIGLRLNEMAILNLVKILLQTTMTWLSLSKV
jgi:sorting nexin-4